jgi:hypothetical protein
MKFFDFILDFTSHRFPRYFTKVHFCFSHKNYSRFYVSTLPNIVGLY